MGRAEMTMLRVRTGIPEFDEMLHGGFLEGDAIAVAGSAGTGKTTLAMQYLLNGILKFGENGIYVTFEQLPDALYRDAMSLGWDLRKLEEKGKLRVICTSPSLLLEADPNKHLLDEAINEVQPRRIVIDSLSHLETYVPEQDYRKETLRLIMYLKTRGLSQLLIWEATQSTGQLMVSTNARLSFLVDTIVLLKYVEIHSSMRKAIAILKMRGSDHDKRLREFEITSGGVKIGMPFTEYDGVSIGMARKAGRGIDDIISRIDEMVPRETGRAGVLEGERRVAKVDK